MTSESRAIAKISVGSIFRRLLNPVSRDGVIRLGVNNVMIDRAVATEPK